MNEKLLLLVGRIREMARGRSEYCARCCDDVVVSSVTCFAEIDRFPVLIIDWEVCIKFTGKY
jgi:hypothetical protein